MTGRSLRGLLIGLSLVVATGFVDLATGPDFGFAFFYFIPIIPIAWRYGLWPGMAVAATSALMWFFADATLKPDQSVLPIAWNALSRLAIFLGGVYLIDRVKQDRTRMAEVDAQRDDFLRILEHELPVPARDMVDALNAAQAKGSLDAADIEALRHRAEALAFLANDFVALGQAQARRLALRSVPVDLAQLVTEVSRQRPDHRAVLVTVPGDGLIVVGDPDRLRQALASAVSEVVADAGALDYVSINVKGRQSEALVTISAAMPASAKRATAKDLRVSLHLSQLLVEAMGGTFSVERAALGKGARVSLTIPTRTLSPTPVALEPAEARQPR